MTNYRNTYANINLSNLKHNYKTLTNFSNKSIFGVVKANAYGHGIYEISKQLEDLSCDYLCVSSIDEAIYLRKKNIRTPILVIGYTDSRFVEVAVKNKITLTVSSIDNLNEYIKTNRNLTIHIKIDTGMNRIGIKKLGEYQEALDNIKKSKLNLEGIFTHFYNSDGDIKDSIRQINYFYSMIDSCEYKYKWIHTSNSDATIREIDHRSNACRCGLSLYGIKGIKSSIDIKPVLSLYSEIIHVKELFPGETIGYGATYKVQEKQIIATVPIGYGDGFIRKNQGRFLCVDGHPCEIVGRVCMDQLMIKIDSFYPIGTPVEIIGEHISLDNMSKELNMIPYEVLTLLNSRINRKYIL